MTKPGPFCIDGTPVNLTANNPGGTFTGTGITDGNAGTFDPAQANEGLNTITYTPGAGNCETTATTDIVINPLPDVDFNVDLGQGCVPFNAVITNLTNPAGSALDWDFGNGDVSNQTGTVTSQYATPGLYDVTLTATSPAGCVNTITKSDAIEAFANAIAGFTVFPDEIGLNSPTVEFTNNSLEADDYTWTFGDGNESNENNPTYSYSSFDANPTVTLVATNAGGCADTARFTLVVIEELLFFVPNTFTPDGDKFNIYLRPYFHFRVRCSGLHLPNLQQMG